MSGLKRFGNFENQLIFTSYFYITARNPFFRTQCIHHIVGIFGCFNMLRINKDIAYLLNTVHARVKHMLEKMLYIDTVSASSLV